MPRKPPETREDFFERVNAALVWRRAQRDPDREADDDLAMFMSIFHPDKEDLTREMLAERRAARRQGRS